MWDGVGVPHSLWAPQSCHRARLLPRGSGPLAGRPSGDPIKPDETVVKHKGLLSSGCFEPPLVSLAWLPTWSPAHPLGPACKSGTHPANKQLVKGPRPGA